MDAGFLQDRCMLELRLLCDKLEQRAEKEADERRSLYEECMSTMSEILEKNLSLMSSTLTLEDSSGGLGIAPPPPTDATTSSLFMQFASKAVGKEEPEDVFTGSRKIGFEGTGFDIGDSEELAWEQRRQFARAPRRSDTELILVQGFGMLRKLGMKMRKEPERYGYRARLINSWKFQAVMSLIILVNTIEVVIDINRSMAEEDFSWSPLTLLVDGIFLLCYTVEFVLRFSVHRLYLFTNDDARWAWLDLFLLLTGYSGWFTGLQSSNRDEANFADATSLRILRYLRLLRVMRVFRILQFVREARLLGQSLVSTLGVLFLSCLGMFCWISLISAVLVQGIGTYLESKSWEPPEVIDAEIDAFFSSIPRTMMTLLQVSTGGLEWSQRFDTLQRIGEFEAFVFILYMVWHHFAFTNIVTGMMVLSMQSLQKPEDEAKQLETREESRFSSRRLRIMMQHSLPGKTRIGTAEELRTLLSDPMLLEYLESHNIFPSEVELFWDGAREMLDEGVPLDILAEGCLSMPGAAMQYDLHLLKAAVQEHIHNQKKRDRDLVVQMDMFQRTVGMHHMMMDIRPAQQQQQQQQQHQQQQQQQQTKAKPDGGRRRGSSSLSPRHPVAKQADDGGTRPRANRPVAL